MRKLLLPILFIFIVTVIGVACGGPASVSTATPPPAKPTTTPAQVLDGKAEQWDSGAPDTGQGILAAQVQGEALGRDIGDAAPDVLDVGAQPQG